MNNINRKLKILILGGSGLLGFHCINYFSRKHETIWSYYNPCHEVKNGFQLAIEEKNSYKKLYKVIKNFEPDVIINTIGLVSVDACETNPKFAQLLNTDFTKSIIKILSTLGFYNCYFVQISSGGVYGNHSDTNVYPWKERDELNPLSIYASTKVQAEQEAKKHIGPVLILRSDFYGINPNRKRFTLLSWIIHNIENNVKMDGWENIYFSPISAEELCETIEKCIQIKLEGIFNVGSENGCNKFDFVETVSKIINKKPNLIRIEAYSKIRPRYSVLSCEKIKTKIDFNCEWKDSLNKYLKKNYVI